MKQNQNSRLSNNNVAVQRCKEFDKSLFKKKIRTDSRIENKQKNTKLHKTEN